MIDEEISQYIREQFPISPTDEEISLLVRARFPIISIVSYEEERVLGQLERVRQDIIDQRSAKPKDCLCRLERDLEQEENEAERTRIMRERDPLKAEIERLAVSHQIVRWSCSYGLLHWSRYETDPQTGQIIHVPRLLNLKGIIPTNPVSVMLFLCNPPQIPIEGVDFSNALIVCCDLHPWLDREDRAGRFNHMLVRAMRDLAHQIRFSSNPRSLFILSPRMVVPFELRKDFQVIEYPLPDIEQLTVRFNKIRSTVQRRFGEDCIELTEDEEKRLIRALSGLTYGEAENVIAKSLANNGRLQKEDIKEALKEKRQIVEKEGILEYFESVTNLSKVGGLETLKTWLEERYEAFKGESIQVEQNGKEYNIDLPVPKGILLIGVPGGGKSLVAKAIASEWGLPLLRLDIGRVYGGIVGQSEENMRRAIQVAESVSPSVMWLDEVEKAFPSNSGSQDAGTSLRVMNTFLTWLQDKKKPVFVVATGNNIIQLPPELTRKGRFDEIFYVSLPNQEAREAIFRVHTEDLPINSEQISTLAETAIYYTGAEIEQVVKNAKFTWGRAMKASSSSQPGEVLVEAMLANMKNFVPLSRREARDGKGLLELMLKEVEMLAIPASANFEDLPQRAEFKRNEPIWGRERY